MCNLKQINYGHCVCGIDFITSNQFHFTYILFYIAIVTLENPLVFFYDIEDSLHGFVVGDTFRIIAFSTVFFSTTS